MRKFSVFIFSLFSLLVVTIAYAANPGQSKTQLSSVEFIGNIQDKPCKVVLKNEPSGAVILGEISTKAKGPYVPIQIGFSNCPTNWNSKQVKVTLASGVTDKLPVRNAQGNVVDKVWVNIFNANRANVMNGTLYEQSAVTHNLTNTSTVITMAYAQLESDIPPSQSSNTDISVNALLQVNVSIP